MSDDLGFIDPTVKKQRARIAQAPRPMDLANRVVGLLDNTKEQGGQILEEVAAALQRDYGVARVVLRKKEYFSRPASGELLDEIAGEVDVVVSALGG
jgi:UDP-N-acetyl-D-mannosaminuronic acid transferase (WecB/TagA/CpsF family)